MRIINAIKYDILFQFRHGFYYAYALASVIYILILRYLSGSIRETAAVLVIFSDPSMLGFFFIGAIVLLEKSQNTLESIFVTPLRVYEYLTAKVVSLTVLSLVMCMAIVLLTFGFHVNFPAFLTGVILNSALFTLLGLVFAARSRDVNRYMLTSTLYLTVFFLPLLDYLGIYHSPLFYLLPTQAGLLLMDAALGRGSSGATTIAVFFLVLWLIIAAIWSARWFHRYVILTHSRATGGNS